MKVGYVHKDSTTDENIRKEFSDVIYPTMVIRTQAETIELQDKEIERLNNIIKDIKSQLEYIETYSSKEDVFEDMKRRLDRIESIVNRK